MEEVFAACLKELSQLFPWRKRKHFWFVPRKIHRLYRYGNIFVIKPSGSMTFLE
jgi:hypothetical protein